MKDRQHLLAMIMILFIACNAYSQKITITDHVTKQPIPNVLIYSEDASKSTQTDEQGIASLDQFTTGDILYLQHTSYNFETIAYEQIVQSNYQIYLKERVISIEEVTISASKWEQDKTEIPNDILQLKAKTISFQNPQTSADLLANSGEVFVQKSQLGGGSPMLRGFAANSVLLVVDGVRMNNAIYRSGNLQNVINIDPNALESAEVVFGPGSVIYGSDALGGVLDFHTITPKFSSYKKRYLKGSAMTRFSSANQEKTGHFHFELGKENISLFSSFSFSDFEDLKTGSNRDDRFPDFGKRSTYVARIGDQDSVVENTTPNVQKFTNYNLFSTINKLRIRPSNLLQLDYGFYFSTTSNIPRYDRLIQTNSDGSFRNAEWYYGPQEWIMHRLSGTSYAATPLFNQARFVVSYQDYEESRNDRLFGSTGLRQQTEHVDILNVNLDFDKPIAKGNLFYGLEFLYNDVTSDAQITDIFSGEISTTATRYPDLGSKYISAAGYMNLKQSFSDKTILNVGGRYSWVGIRAETSDSDASLLGANEFNLNNGALNGTVGLVHKLTETDAISALVSSGFRSPNIDDVGKVFELDEDEITVPNEDLKPETSYNFEVSYRKVLDQKFTADVVIYYSQLSNAIVRAPFQINNAYTINIDGQVYNVFAQQNTNKARIYGGGLKLLYEINQFLAASSSLSFTDGRDITNDDPLRHTPPVFGKTTLAYKNNKLRIEIYSEYNGSKSFENLAPAEQSKTWIYSPDGTLSWMTFNLKGSYQANKFLLINAGVENILDKHYRTYSSGISAPGRNFILSLRATF